MDLKLGQGQLSKKVSPTQTKNPGGSGGSAIKPVRSSGDRRTNTTKTSPPSISTTRQDSVKKTGTTIPIKKYTGNY